MTTVGITAGHVRHMFGHTVRDAATGRVGVLMDVTGFVDGSRAYHLPRVTVRLAFLRPLNGGGEWTTAPGNILSPTESWGDE